jgi:hypothetical protein
MLMVLLGGIGSGYFLNKRALEDKENPLEPEIGGMDARNVVMGVGALAAMVLGGPLGMIGAGAVAGAWTSKDAMTKVGAQIEEFRANQLLAKPVDPATVQGLIAESSHVPGGVDELVRQRQAA